ncbi:MAG: NAD-dependent epimerase/dehydratase family protein [Geothrix sp.]|nr:NAD-dependent epimerase/dehydratase family protein [Geothrix sp.]
MGQRLARRRSGEGPVLALVRRESGAEDLARRGIPALALDFDGATPWHPPSDLGALVYLAPPSGEGQEDIRLARFLRALGSVRPQVFVYISTTGVYGDTGGAPVDEASPPAPGDDRSRQRLDAEGRVARWCLDRAVRGVVFRVPAIYGPHRLPLDRLRRGEPVLRAEDSGPGNRIHVDDLVEACMAALDRPVAGVFNLVDGLPESLAAFTARVATLAGLPAPPQVSWAGAQQVLSPGLLSFLRESRRVTSRRAEELGWTPRYGSPGSGIRASLAEMGLAIAADQ